MRFELAADLATPRAVFERLVRPRRLLNGRYVLPSLVVARTVSTMQRIEDAKLRLPRGIEDLLHMRNAVIRFRNGPDAVPYFTSLGNEIVIRIDHEKCGDLLVIGHFCHAASHPDARMRGSGGRVWSGSRKKSLPDVGVFFASAFIGVEDLARMQRIPSRTCLCGLE